MYFGRESSEEKEDERFRDVQTGEISKRYCDDLVVNKIRFNAVKRLLL